MVCGEPCIGCDVAVIWCFCLFRVVSWSSTWRPSLWARQSLRSMCWWDILLQSCLCFCPMCNFHCCAEHFVLFAGQLFPASSVHVSCRIQGLSFANSAEIPATESWECNWKWVCHLSVLLCQRAWTVVLRGLELLGSVYLWTMLLVLWAQAAGLSGVQGLDVEKQHLWCDPKCLGMW